MRGSAQYRRHRARWQLVPVDGSPGGSSIRAQGREFRGIARLNESVGGAHRPPRGHLVVTAPVLFGRLRVMPVVTESLRAYPDVTVSCVFVDRVVNLLDEGVDVAIRVGRLPDSALYSRRARDPRPQSGRDGQRDRSHASGSSVARR